MFVIKEKEKEKRKESDEEKKRGKARREREKSKLVDDCDAVAIDSATPDGVAPRGGVRHVQTYTLSTLH